MLKTTLYALLFVYLLIDICNLLWYSNLSLACRLRVLLHIVLWHCFCCIFWYCLEDFQTYSVSGLARINQYMYQYMAMLCIKAWHFLTWYTVQDIRARWLQQFQGTDFQNIIEIFLTSSCYVCRKYVLSLS